MRPKKPEIRLGSTGPYFKLAAVWDGHAYYAVLSVSGSLDDHREAQGLSTEIQKLPRTKSGREAIEAAHAWLKPLGFGEMDPRHWFERATKADAW